MTGSTDELAGDSIRLSLMDCQVGRPQTSLMAQKLHRTKYNTINFLMEKNAKSVDCFRAAFVSTDYLCCF